MQLFLCARTTTVVGKFRRSQTTEDGQLTTDHGQLTTDQLCGIGFDERRTMSTRKVRLCAFLLLLVLWLSPAHALSQEQPRPKRHIIVCVDGVGISTINKLREQGHFKMFRTPSRMVSTFPSLTNQAISTILQPAGARTAIGYEDNYFDVDSNKMRGGVFDRLRGDKFVQGTFRELFDYHPSAIKSGLGYAAPPISTYLEALSDLIRLRQKARNDSEPVFFGYTGATDSLAHLGGEKLLNNFLRRLDSSLEDVVNDSKVPTAVTVFSDHGNHFRKYRRVKLKSPLRKAGFRLDSKIKDQRSVVIPQFGLIGNAILFTQEANEQKLAKVTAAIEGVDFAAFEKDGVVYVNDREGEAIIERLGSSYRYRALKGDPLDLLPVVEQLTRKTGATDSFFSDSAWFEATIETSRPDAVHRIFKGVTSGVSNQANVILNFEDGYYSGSSLLDLFAILQATHGNLGPEQSLGFVMTTDRDLPPFVRSEDLWQEIGSPVLKRSQVNRAATPTLN